LQKNRLDLDYKGEEMFFTSLFLVLIGCTADVKYDSATADSAHKECATLKDHQICDFDAIDINGVAALSDLYGRPIVLDLSAMWCGPCKEAAASLQETADSIPGVTFLTVLIEDSYGNPPDAEDINSWINNAGITSEPVWGSSRDILTQDPLEMKDHLFLTGWPSFYFIDSEGNLQEYIRGYSESTIREKALNLN
jgi:thiol-disulfide isomerase/thioredoxin